MLGWWTQPEPGIGRWETNDPNEAKKYTKSEAVAVAKCLTTVKFPGRDIWIATEHLDFPAAPQPPAPESGPYKTELIKSNTYYDDLRDSGPTIKTEDYSTGGSGPEYGTEDLNAAFAAGSATKQAEVEGLKKALEDMIPECISCGKPTANYVCDDGFVCNTECFMAHFPDSEIEVSDIEIETDGRVLNALTALSNLGKG
jgi:hypothetical protein